MRFLFATTAAALALSACSGGETPPGDDEVTETQMDEVDVIDGTISDDMVDLDTAEQPDQMAKPDVDGDGDNAGDGPQDSSGDNEAELTGSE